MRKITACCVVVILTMTVVVFYRKMTRPPGSANLSEGVQSTVVSNPNEGHGVQATDLKAPPVVESPLPEIPPLPSGPLAVSPNPALTSLLDRESHERIPSDIASRIPWVDDPGVILSLERLIRDHTDEDTARHEAINILRRSLCRGVVSDLIFVLGNNQESERFRAFAAQHLGGMINDAEPAEERPRCSEVMQLLLNDRHISVKREALASLVRIGDQSAMSIVEMPLDHPGLSGMRDLAIRLYKELDNRLRIPAIRKCAYDNDLEVRIAAIYVLGQWKDEASEAAFIAAKDSSIARLQRAGFLAINLLKDGKNIGGK